MLKRVREDGHLSKEEYTVMSSQDTRSVFNPSSEGFTRATPNTLAARRMVVAQRPAKKEEFAKHIKALNALFYDWLQREIAGNPCCDLTDGFQDYVDHVTSLEDRYLRTYGECLTFGSGDCGQLAHGIERDEDLMVKYPRVVYSLRDKKVCGIACGGIHNAVYTETGQVYTWGCSDDGSLGRPGEESVPLLVEGLVSETVIGLACGDGQTIAVTTAGDVWGWGCYKDKEGKKWFNPSAGASNQAKDCKKQQDTAMKIQGISNVVEVACGSSFNLAKCADGVLYSWGLGECGELGRHAPPMKIKVSDDMEYDLASILRHHITPGRMYIGNLTGGENRDALLTPVQDVKSFGCGAYHSMVAVVGDVVYSCGLNNYGQLGLGSADTTSRDYLVEVPSLRNRGIVQLKGGMHHSLVLSSSGQMLAFGRGDSGQVGSSLKPMKNAGDFTGEPLPPDLPAHTTIVSIGCGGNHNLALTDKSEVYSWGYGDMLALGHGKDEDERLPRKLNFSKAKINNITITQVAGGGQHSAIVGRVVTA
ncbi:regulator of chromosome condensation like protein putative [Ochromonadaceae sp. CCMP2298]|nr:regulator of chromosome condensation like protein putative [Ochromonadaceae sp. CCMP2298]